MVEEETIKRPCSHRVIQKRQAVTSHHWIMPNFEHDQCQEHVINRPTSKQNESTVQQYGNTIGVGNNSQPPRLTSSIHSM